MLKLRKGCTVPFPEKLLEGYEYIESGIIANVDADKIRSVLEHFIAIHDEPVFFILELPAKLDDETKFGTWIAESVHRDVYYIDGCTTEEALDILIRTADLMINDGLCTFGFGCHQSKEEIMVGKYNVISIYTRNIEGYDGFFESHEIDRVENLITAWDTFTQETPGECVRFDTDGKSVYDIPEMFKERGIYLAEQREE